MYDTLYAILNKSENATLQYFIFCEKVLDGKYLLKINNVSQTSSKRFVETPPICLFWCFSYVPYCVECFIHWILQLRMRKKIVMLIRIRHTCVALLHRKTVLSLETSSEVNFQFIKFVKKGKCLPLTKANREYYINITFPESVIVENIIPRNVIINRGAAEVDNHISRDDICDYHPLRECNIYFIIPNTKLDSFFLPFVFS